VKVSKQNGGIRFAYFMETLEEKLGPVVIPPDQTGGVPVKCWAKQVDQETGKPILALEEKAIRQASEAARLPCAYRHVALMPDAHTGFGVPVGCVLPLENAVSPNAVGVDIGCGMCAWNSGIKVADLDARKLMIAIKDDIPVGEGKNRSNSDLWLGHKRIVEHIADVEKKVEEAKNLCKTLDYPDWSKAKIQVGTLGGGNHFIELQQDAEGNAWFMLHSGSRGLGAQLAKKFHHLAVMTCRKYFTRLPNEELAFLPADSNEGQWYIASLLAAQDFALANRLLMMIVCQEALREQYHQTNPLKDIINIHHNYATIEHHFGRNVWVHRKGATLARKTTVGIIPGSMCSKSYIIKGQDHPESFSSCSHGAGRPFSRTEAKKRIAEGIDPPQIQQLGNVELYGVREAHDELGSAYKNIDTVMNNQKDLVDIQVELIPVAVLKG
jgi:tRNA-splicing ligase RtcB